jgi:hypothetical protein
MHCSSSSHSLPTNHGIQRIQPHPPRRIFCQLPQHESRGSAGHILSRRYRWPRRMPYLLLSLRSHGRCRQLDSDGTTSPRRPAHWAHSLFPRVHRVCLVSWLESLSGASATCPSCRSDLSGRPAVPVSEGSITPFQRQMLNLDEYNDHWDRYFAEEVRAGRIDEVVENPHPSYISHGQHSSRAVRVSLSGLGSMNASWLPGSNA